MGVVHDNGKVMIEGVKGFSPVEFASSPHGCQARILEVLGEPPSYDDLVCFGAFSFRVQVHADLCPSGAHPYCGYQCVDGSEKAIPWRRQVFESPPRAERKTDRAVFETIASDALRESIDRGTPVHYGGEEDGLIIGYGDSGRKWWCVHPYHEWGAEAFWHDQATGLAGGSWPWSLAVWTEPKPVSERPPERELLREALEQAVTMWSSKRVDDYFVGDAAYDYWLTWLRGIDSGNVDDPAAGMQGNGWCYDVLVQSRRIASKWLASWAGMVTADVAGELQRISNGYSWIADACMRGLDCTWDLAPHPEKVSDWTRAMRSDQADRLEAARELDRAAVGSMKRVLEMM